MLSHVHALGNLIINYFFRYCIIVYVAKKNDKYKSTSLPPLAKNNKNFYYWLEKKMGTKQHFEEKNFPLNYV